MSLTLNVGLAKTILKEDSVCISCNIELTLDVASLNDVDGFDQMVEHAFFVCRNAVDGELSRQAELPNADSPVIAGRSCACRTHPDDGTDEIAVNDCWIARS